MICLVYEKIKREKIYSYGVDSYECLIFHTNFLSLDGLAFGLDTAYVLVSTPLNGRRIFVKSSIMESTCEKKTMQHTEREIFWSNIRAI